MARPTLSNGPRRVGFITNKYFHTKILGASLASRPAAKRAVEKVIPRHLGGLKPLETTYTHCMARPSELSACRCPLSQFYCVRLTTVWARSSVGRATHF